MNRLTKPTLLVLCICFFSTSVSAQPWKSIKLSNGEIGINFLKYSDFSRYDFYGSLSGKLNPSFGISYKAEIKLHLNFRAYSSYYSEFNHHESGESISCGSFDYNDEERRADLSIGLEKQMSKGWVSTYIFGEIYQQYGIRKREGYSGGLSGLYLFDDSYQFYQLGCATGVGIKINIFKQLHLNIESQTRALREFKPNGYYVYRRTKYQAYFNPVSRFSLNYTL